MKPRDRLVVCVLVAAAGIVAIWVGLVSPKRQDAANLGTKLTVAQARLGTAQSQLAQAKAAEAGYTTNLRVVKSLYKAVPADDGVPRLVVSLDRTSHHKRVDFRVVTVPGAAGSPAAPTTPGGVATGLGVPGGLSPISFTFTFAGGYIDLQKFLQSVHDFTLLNGSQVIAHGRLLTIQSVALTQPQSVSKGVTTQAAVTATAYSQLPATAVSPTSGTATASTPSTPAPTTNAAATVATPTNPTR
ncbi:MAG: type II secretion system protein M [Actinobacteria bacterium]|nr:type II secretion system protein M [Actinomycetota bacterium]